jgi:hypothetical protein
MAEEKKGSGITGKEPRINKEPVEKPQDLVTNQNEGASKKDKKEK